MRIKSNNYGKKYTRKQVSSLSELDLEQERIKYKAKRIEDDMLDIFSPQQLAITVISNLLRRKKKNTQPSYAVDRTPSGNKKKKEKSGTVTSTVSGLVQKPIVKKTARAVGISFLRWQAFNLALCVGKKIWKKVQEKRLEKKSPLQHT